MGNALHISKTTVCRYKVLVEDAVIKTYLLIYAPLRNRVYHSLEEFKGAVAELVEKYNRKRLTRCDYSRLECFPVSEKSMLAPLPPDRFEFKRRASLRSRPMALSPSGATGYYILYRIV